MPVDEDGSLPALVTQLLSTGELCDGKLARVSDVRHLADLWAGYGSVQQVSVVFDETETRSLILKHISPPSGSISTDDEIDESHVRKLLSYLVEVNFYTDPRLGPSLVSSGRQECGIAKVYGHMAARSGWTSDPPDLKTSGSAEGPHVALLLSNLCTDGYPLLGEGRSVLSESQTDAALRWLAHFHAHFWGFDPASGTNIGAVDKSFGACAPPLRAATYGWDGKGVWEVGGYSYLATRHEEHQAIPRSSPFYAALGPTSSLAFAVEHALQQPQHPARTLVHGDVKAANLAFSHGGAGKEVQAAMYDFQYVGSGLGVSDLAKFLTTSVPRDALEGDGEERLLRRYHTYLCSALSSHPCWRGDAAYQSEKAAEAAYPLSQLLVDWQAALCSWTRFQAGWGFWGNVNWLQQRVIGILQDSVWIDGCVAEWEKAGSHGK